MHVYVIHLDQTDAYNALAYAKHLQIIASWSHIKHGLNTITLINKKHL